MAASAVDKVFDELGKMSVLDLVELKKKIEDEWGITAAAPVAVAAPGAVAGGDGAAAEEEKTAFDVVLTAAGGQKIQVIKVVRAAHGRPDGRDQLGVTRPPRRQVLHEAHRSVHRPVRPRAVGCVVRRGEASARQG